LFNKSELRQDGGANRLLTSFFSFSNDSSFVVLNLIDINSIFYFPSTTLRRRFLSLSWLTLNSNRRFILSLRSIVVKVNYLPSFILYFSGFSSM